MTMKTLTKCLAHLPDGYTHNGRKSVTLVSLSDIGDEERRLRIKQYVQNLFAGKKSSITSAEDAEPSVGCGGGVVDHNRSDGGDGARLGGETVPGNVWDDEMTSPSRGSTAKRKRRDSTVHSSDSKGANENVSLLRALIFATLTSV